MKATGSSLMALVSSVSSLRMSSISILKASGSLKLSLRDDFHSLGRVGLTSSSNS